MKKFLVFLILLFCFQLVSFSKDLDYIHGHFEKFKTDIDISSGMPLKLQDGKILLVCAQGCGVNEKNAIFDPETDKVEAIGDFKYGLVTRGEGILLPNGKVLFIVEYKGYYNFYDEYTKLLYKEILKVLPGKTTEEKDKNYRVFRKLPEEERAKIYMPIVKSNPELLKKYNEHKELKEISYYAQLYNPETREFELTGRITNDMPRSFNVNMISLKNGNVLIFYENNYIELYDYKTGKFTPYKSDKLIYDKIIKTEIGFDKIADDGSVKYKTIELAPENYKKVTIMFDPLFTLKDGRILGNLEGKFAIYDYDKDEIFISQYYIGGWNERYPKLSNDTVIFSREFENHKYRKSGNEDNMGLASYDPYTDTLKDVGELLIPRGMVAGFRKISLPNDTVLILGGLNHRRESPLNAIAPHEHRVEIFNPKTGISKRIKRTPHDIMWSYILLNDGRILLWVWENQLEVFIPKNYKKMKNKNI